ncbi:MAG: MFS transporter, partial [Synechocystis sp.]
NATTNEMRRIPLTVEIAFYLGAGLFLGTILWTVISTPERPPENLEKFRLLKKARGGLGNSVQQIRETLTHLPKTMVQLAGVQIFTWLGIFCFFIYFPPAVARNIFGAVDLNSSLYNNGIEWAGLCFAVFNAVCIVFSFGLPVLARRISRKVLHCLCLMGGSVGLISVEWIHRPGFLLLSMVGFGMAWASAQSIPYAILTHAIPTQQRGIYQGIFNFFIVLPEIGVSLTFGWVMQTLLHDDRLLAVVLGGVFLAIAAGLTLLVQTAEGQTGETAAAVSRDPVPLGE